MPRTKKKQKTFAIESLLDGLRDSVWITVEDPSIEGLSDGDMLLVGRGRKKLTDGDYVLWQDDEGEFFVERYSQEEGEPEGTMYGVASSLVRRFPKTKKRQPKNADTWGGGPNPDKQLERLRQKLMRLERLPENEAIAFQLETEIYRLGQGTESEWPGEILA